MHEAKKNKIFDVGEIKTHKFRDLYSLIFTD